MSISICSPLRLVILLLCRFLRNGCPGLGALLFILLCLPVMALDPIDPEKPVYQPNWLVPEWAVKIHPGMEEKQYTDPHELVELEKKRFGISNRQKQMNLGLIFLGAGLPMFMIAFFASPVLKQYGFQMVSHFMFPTGLGLASSGIILRELAKWYLVTPIALVLLTIYSIISYKFKDKGLTVKNPLKGMKNKIGNVKNDTANN